jgi:protease-4
MAFVKGAWSILVGIKDALVLIFMLIFFSILLGALSSRPNPAAVKDGALVLNLDGVVVEELSQLDPLAALTSGAAPIKEYRLRDVVRTLEGAVKDDQVKVVVLDLDRFLGGGQASMENIGDAIAKVRDAGKPVLAYATAYSDSSYQLAAHASELWLDPLGGVLAVGPGGSRLYYKDLIDRLKVTAHIYKVGTYKSAVEPYSRSDQSPEAEEALKSVYDALWSQYLGDVEAARPSANLRAYASDPAQFAEAAGGDLAQLALEQKLVDKLGDRIAFGEAVAKIAGVDDEDRLGSYNKTDMSVWLAANSASTSGEEIGVINIAGTIVDGEAGAGVAAGGRIAEQLYDGLAKRDLKALVVRVNSPGGSVLASEQIRKAIERYTKKDIPVVVSMGNVAASGGYWVSMPASKIFAEPSTITGSIGIFAVLPSFERAFDDIGINADGVQTTPLSGQPDFAGGFNDDLNRVLQSGVETGYNRFLTLVAKSRGKTKEEIDAIGQGRIWDGAMAKKLGLVDALGGMDEAMAEAAKLAKIDGDYHAVYLEPEADQLTQFLNGLTQQSQSDYVTGYDIMARLSMSRQMGAGQIVTDLQRLVEARGVQAECLECSALAKDYRRSKDAETYIAKWMQALATP